MANNLHRTVNHVRRVLDPGTAGPSPYLSLHEGQLALCPEASLWTDVEAFEEAVTVARRARAVCQPAIVRELHGLYCHGAC